MKDFGKGREKKYRSECESEKREEEFRLEFQFEGIFIFGLVVKQHRESSLPALFFLIPRFSKGESNSVQGNGFHLPIGAMQ